MKGLKNATRPAKNKLSYRYVDEKIKKAWLLEGGDKKPNKSSPKIGAVGWGKKKKIKYLFI